MKKTTFCILFLLAVQLLAAQRTIILEQVRCFSTIGPVMNYWESSEVKRTFATDLRQTLLRHKNLLLSDTSQVPIQALTSAVGASQINPAFVNADTGLLHLYLDIYELDLNTFFSYVGQTPDDSVIQKRAKSVFILKAWTINSRKQIVSKDELHVVITLAQTIGMGNPFILANGYNSTPPTPKGFTGMLQKGMDILFDPNNELQRVEMNVPPAYMVDNYILPNIINRPRIFATTKKGISVYNYGNAPELIRMGEQMYEEILVKGKKIKKYPDDLTAAIKSTEHYANSDFVFLSQDCRDVTRDRNYQVKLTTQIDPGFAYTNPENYFTNFLEGRFHYLFREKDTIASFSIKKRVRDETGKKLFPNKVYNGADSSSIFTVDRLVSEWPVIYNYVVTGKINGQDFSIEYSGRTNNLKEIYLNGKLLCIAEGKFSPDKFVVFDASLSPEILNQLFFIGFNHFFV